MFLVLVAIDALLFLSGAIAHLGIAIPLGVARWKEPLVIGAAVVEGTAGALLTTALVCAGLGWGRSATMMKIALWYSFIGVLWGMTFLALKTHPEARTVTNDFLHIGMILVSTLALVRMK